MNNKVISLPIKGIDRSKPIHTTDEGAAQEVINLRPLNGAWRNVGEKEEISKFYSDRIFAAQNSNPYFFPTFYRHPSLPEKCYVSYWEDTKTIELYAFCSPQTFNPNWSNNLGNWVLNDGYWDDNGTWIDTGNVWHDSSNIFTIPNGETFKCFAHLNNVLMVVTDVNRYFFLWNAETLSYLILNDLPTLTNIKVSESLNVISPPSMYYSASGDANISYAELMGLYYKYMATEKTKGYFSGYIASRLAYKLYDNTYVPCSEIFITKIGKNGNGIFSFYNPSTYETAPGSGLWFAQGMYLYNFCANTIQFDINLHTSEIDTIKTYIDKGIIQSLNILCSSEFDDLEYGTAFTDWDTHPHSPTTNPDGLPYVGDFYPKQRVETVNVIELNTLFYDIYDIKEVSSLITVTPLTEKKIDIDTIETYDHVIFDNFYNNKLLAESYFNYNERLHLANITNIIGNGTSNNERNILFKLNSDSFTYQLSSVNTETDYGYKIIIEVEIVINNKNKYIRYDITDSCTVYEELTTGLYQRLLLHNHIMFPDYRAKYIRVLLLDTATNVYKIGVYQGDSGLKDAIFKLKSSPVNNIAYYNEFKTLGASYYKQFITPAVKLLPDISGLTTYTAPAIDNIYTDTNRVQVSEQNNIFVYPAKNSYRFAEQDNVVIGLQTVAEELSATRFGQFPLYVFTKQGVWALEQGSGEVLYSNITPLDYSPCVNANLICSINGAVVFATATGLKLIAGRQVIEISQGIEELIVDNPLLTNPNYLAVVNSESTVNLLQCINKAVTFTDEITSYKSAYDRELKELFITNPVKATGNPAISRPPVRSDYDYSFIFHKESKNWYKFQTQIVNFIQNFYGFSALNFDGTLLSITNLERESNSSHTYSHILYQSRPFSLQTMSFKKIEHIVTRIYARVTRYIVNISEDTQDYRYENKFTSMYLFGSIDGQEYRLVGGGYSQNTIVTDILWRKTYVSCRYFIVVITVDAKDVMLNRIDFEAVMKFANKIR